VSGRIHFRPNSAWPHTKDIILFW